MERDILPSCQSPISVFCLRENQVEAGLNRLKTDRMALATYIRTELKKLDSYYDAEQLIIKIIHMVEGTMTIELESKSEMR